MSKDHLPRGRRRDDSVRAEQRRAPLQSADRHARRIGVLGCVEHRCMAVPVPKTEARARPKLRRVALIAVPLSGPDWLQPTPSTVAYIRVAAA